MSKQITLSLSVNEATATVDVFNLVNDYPYKFISISGNNAFKRARKKLLNAIYGKVGSTTKGTK